MRRLLLLLTFVVCVVANPARAQFCPGTGTWVFTDVPANDQFCGFITWMAKNAVTGGCEVIDANNRKYCPKDSVTREQMAAFMSRVDTALFPTSCAIGEVMKWNGTDWACAADNTGISGGTVTSISAGTGLQGSPNPITTTGSLNLAFSYQLPQGCANGQVPMSNGTGGWTCQPDANAGGTVASITAGPGLTGGTITQNGTIGLAASQLLPTTGCATDQVPKWNGSAWECATIGGGSTGSGPTTMFLRIQPGGSPTPIVKGDSTDPDHVDEIVVLSYSNGRSNSSGIGGAGRVNMQDLSFTMYVSRASPVLHQYVANGALLGKVILTVRTPYSTPTPSTFPHQKITLEGVRVSSASAGGSGGESKQTENYSMNFAKIETLYTPRDPNGVAGTPVRSCWDVAQNIAC